MDTFGIAEMFERSAAPVRQPVAAPCESLRCRAFYPQQYSFGSFRRCTGMAEQHDGVCWTHADYYRDWWRRRVPTSDYMEDVILSNNDHEMQFQVSGGYVSLADFELAEALRENPGQHFFFQWLCTYADFDGRRFPASVAACVGRIFKTTILNSRITYEKAFGALHSSFERGYIFEVYLQFCVAWIKDNIQGILGPAKMLDAFLRSATVNYRDIAGRRLVLAEYLNALRNPHIASARILQATDDDRYNTCKGRFWLWVSDLKQAERNAYDPLKAELMAAAWAPTRMPFWCLDVDEVAEDYPEGLPSAAAWSVLCASITV
jgi:hypothetical protein